MLHAVSTSRAIKVSLDDAFTATDVQDSHELRKTRQSDQTSRHGLFDESLERECCQDIKDCHAFEVLDSNLLVAANLEEGLAIQVLLTEVKYEVEAEEHSDHMVKIPHDRVHLDVEANEEDSRDTRVGNEDEHDSVKDALPAAFKTNDEVFSLQVRLEFRKEARVFILFRSRLLLDFFLGESITILAPGIRLKLLLTLLTLVDHATNELDSVK